MSNSRNPADLSQEDDKRINLSNSLSMFSHAQFKPQYGANPHHQNRGGLPHYRDAPYPEVIQIAERNNRRLERKP